MFLLQLFDAGDGSRAEGLVAAHATADQLVVEGGDLAGVGLAQVVDGREVAAGEGFVLGGGGLFGFGGVGGEDGLVVDIQRGGPPGGEFVLDAEGLLVHVAHEQGQLAVAVGIGVPLDGGDVEGRLGGGFVSTAQGERQRGQDSEESGGGIFHEKRVPCIHATKVRFSSLPRHITPPRFLPGRRGGAAGHFHEKEAARQGRRWAVAGVAGYGCPKPCRRGAPRGIFCRDAQRKGAEMS